MMFRAILPALAAVSLLLAACQSTSTGTTAGTGVHQARDAERQAIDEKARQHAERNRGRGGL